MRTRLMYPDRDLAEPPPLPLGAEVLRRDLELDELLRVMAGGNPLIGDACAHVLLAATGGGESAGTRADIVHRQDVMRDVLANQDVVGELRAIADDGLDRERMKVFGLFSRATPEKVLLRSIDVMEMYLEVFTALRKVAAAYAPRFQSAGFRAFFADITTELGDAYLAAVRTRLDELRFDHGVVISARLGPGNHGMNYVLRRPPRGGLRSRVHRDPHWLPIELDDAAEELSVVLGRGMLPAADALAQACEHVTRYLRTVSLETGFHLACARLHGALTAIGEVTCFPEIATGGELGFDCDGLRDPSLAVRTAAPTVGSTVDARGCSLVMITGANRGGKTTFLRSIGLAQMMAQAGMFVVAGRYRTGVRTGVFTHFTPDEDPTMVHGRLDAELARMSRLADAMAPGALLLCNESFSSTNEREGSEIARTVVDAARESGITVCFVTHMFALADGLHRRADPRARFLRAERLDDGGRTYRLVDGRPLTTSFGDDLFRSVFGDG